MVVSSAVLRPFGLSMRHGVGMGIMKKVCDS